MSSWSWLVSLLLVPGSLLCSRLYAVEDSTRRAELDQRRKILEAEGELEALKLEDRLSKPGQPVERLRVELSDAVPKLNRITDRLETTHRARLEALTTLARETKAERDRGLALWQETAESVLDLEQQRRNFEDQQVRTASAQRLFDLPMSLTFAWGILVLMIATAMALHERRTDLRRWWRSSRAVVVLLAVLGMAPILLAVDRGPLNNRLHQVETEIATLREKLAKQRSSLLDAWVELLARPGEPGVTAHGQKMRGWEEDTMKQLRVILVAGFTTQRALAETDRQLAEAQRQREDLSRVGLRSRLSGLGFTALRVALCVLLVVGPIGLLYWSRRSLRQRLAEEARTCPRCLARDTLKVRRSPKQDPLYPDARHVECTRCSHEFRERFRKLARLCFPTIGIRNSGKTRWLGTTYMQVMNAQAPKGAVLQAAPSLAEQQVFGEVLRQILDAEHTDPTVHDVYLPSPLTLHLEDRDTLGGRQALVNLFDFSGEVMNRSIDVDQLRCRALLMDGFVLFLDPTQVRGGMLEQQRDAIRRFHDDLSDIRKLEPGKPVPTPVAVCLSRLDLLAEESPFGPVSSDWMQQLRQTLHAPPSAVTLRERSRLCEEALPFMFQGWDVGRELRERFGKAVFFFPLASLGLHGEGLSTFEPFGLFEPLLWLLHRHGYCVLDETLRK